MKKFPFQTIIHWYQNNGRHDLPWRTHQLPYHVWISEIFLQQTQVSRVIPYFENVIKRFPDITSLSQTNYETFFPYYDGLGYYSRARNMLKTAKIIHDNYGGDFPQSYEHLLKLPGIGPYTAQAIIAFGYNQAILAFDTNIEKIFARYYLGTRFEKLSKDMKLEIQKQFEETGISGREINAALMDFSSMIDLNEKQNIDWQNYPLKDSKFFKEKGVNETKEKKETIKIDKKDSQIYVIIHENHSEYYSANPDTFVPFLLEKTDQDHRHYIKNYFKTNYNITLSVRPPYKKIKTPKGSFFFYHAQVQTGNHDFGVFEKQNKKEWEGNF